MTKRVILPYTGRITMEIAHIIRNNTELEVAFRPIYKISTILNNNRTKNKDQIGVYKFPCNSCPSVYIGETGRDLPVRLAEHMRDIRNNKDTSGPYIHKNSSYQIRLSRFLHFHENERADLTGRIQFSITPLNPCISWRPSQSCMMLTLFLIQNIEILVSNILIIHY